MKRALALVALLLTLVPVSALAQVSAAPSLINFQGRLAKPDGTPVANGNYSIRFSLWDAASGGTEKWNQTVNPVAVKNGTFAVLLNVAAPASLFSGNLWLEIKIGASAPLTPRQQMVSVAFAMKANTVPDGAIGTAQLAGNAVTSGKIANNAVGNTDLASDVASLNKVSGGVLTSSGGKIGLGTTTPGFPLTFPDTLGDKISLFGQSGAHYGFGIQNGLFQMHTFTTADDIAFGVGSSASFTERMRVKGNGLVGIGTVTPNVKLHVVDTAFTVGRLQSNSTAGTWLSLVNTSAGGHNWNIISSGSGNGEGVGKLLFNDQTSGGTRFTLDGTGAIVNGVMRTNVIEVVGGSDVAEPYHIAPSAGTQPLPGMVVAIDPEKIGQMRVVSRAYDKTVAGIISGANGINPGITLRQKGTIADGELPVASIGRVWCWCDADANGAIEAGDMLTTSATPGHAMKVSDHSRADGAIIGKAMSNLKSGKGLVLILVSLK